MNGYGICDAGLLRARSDMVPVVSLEFVDLRAVQSGVHMKLENNTIWRIQGHVFCVCMALKLLEEQNNIFAM